MKVYAALCNHTYGDFEFVWASNHMEANVYFREDLLDIEIDVSEYLPAV